MHFSIIIASIFDSVNAGLYNQPMAENLYGKSLHLVVNIVFDAIRASVMKDRKPPEEAIKEETEPAPAYPALSPRDNMPTTQETVDELRRRLAKELYRMELDLAGGGRIAGKICDCLSGKHHFGIEATAEELIPMDSNPIYARTIAWLNQHASEFEVEEVAKHQPEYYQNLAPQVRALRKEVLGTEKLGAMLNPDERQEVAKRALEMVSKEVV